MNERGGSGQGAIGRPPGATEPRAPLASLPVGEWWAQVEAFVAAKYPDPAAYQFPVEQAYGVDEPPLVEHERISFKMTLSQTEIEAIREGLAKRKREYSEVLHGVTAT